MKQFNMNMIALITVMDLCGSNRDFRYIKDFNLFSSVDIQRVPQDS